MRRLLLALTGLAALAVPGSASAIVGGHPATRAYPAMAELDLKGEFNCGATLVRPDWVLTAAHCVQGTAPDQLSFVLGRRVRSDPGGDVIGAAQVVVNDQYQGGGHDVAVVHLARASTQQPASIVSLAQRDLWAAGRTATVIGWGATSYMGDVSDDLLEVQVPVVADNKCALSYPLDYEVDTMMCAGEFLGGKDSCNGDSGGPLLVPDASNNMLVAGVVSFGTGCAVATQYGIYSRVGDNELHTWLDSKLPAASAPPVSTPVTPGNPAVATPVTLRFSKSLGSARKAVRSRRLRVHVISSGPVFSLKVTLTRSAHGKVVTLARGKLSRLTGDTTLKLKVLKALRRGTLRLKLTARDAQGKTVKAAGSARLTR